MTKYVCLNCGREIDEKDIQNKVRCPYCGGRIILKKRPEIIKKVKAR